MRNRARAGGPHRGPRGCPLDEQRPAVVQVGPDVLIAVRVQPRAPRNQLVVARGEFRQSAPRSITIRVTAPPVAGAANAACCAFLAEVLGIPKSRVALARGEAARHKLLRIRDADAAAVLARLRSTEKHGTQTIRRLWINVPRGGSPESVDGYCVFSRRTWNSKRAGALFPPMKNEASSRRRSLALGSTAEKTRRPSRRPPGDTTTNRLRSVA